MGSYASEHYKLRDSLHLPATEGGGPSLAMVEGPY